MIIAVMNAIQIRSLIDETFHISLHIHSSRAH